MARSPSEIFEDHLRRADEGDVEGDIRKNFAENCVLLTTYGRFEGHEGVREAAALLMRQLPNGRWHYEQTSVTDNVAFLEWTGEGDGCTRVRDGADTFVIHDDRIKVMTIHYTVETEPQAGSVTSPH